MWGAAGGGADVAMAAVEQGVAHLPLDTVGARAASRRYVSVSLWYCPVTAVLARATAASGHDHSLIVSPKK